MIQASTLTFVHSLDIFEKFMYWTDPDIKSVERSNRFTGENTTLLRTTIQYAFDIRVWHPAKQPQRDSKSIDYLDIILLRLEPWQYNVCSTVVGGGKVPFLSPPVHRISGRAMHDEG